MRKNSVFGSGRYSVLYLIVVLAIFLFMKGQPFQGGHSAPQVEEGVQVVRVIDGDTVEIQGGEKVRVIGINAPESTKTREPYGEEAKAFGKMMLEGKRVWLEKDVTDRDRYGRLLRHLWLEKPKQPLDFSQNYGAMALAGGYAQVYTFPPDVEYEKVYLDISREARNQEKGLWGIEKNGTTRGESFDR